MNKLEIGSEFESKECGKLRNNFFDDLFSYMCDYTFTYSGRTAIEIVLANEPRIKKIAMPSYCCKSMLQPFKDKKIEIVFYQINFNNSIEITGLSSYEDLDAIFLCNYFGFNIDYSKLLRFDSENILVIEDITHSLLSKFPYHNNSDYVVCSLRKWNNVLCGGFCGSLHKTFSIKPNAYPSKAFINEKMKAMKQKKEYLNTLSINNKNEFLESFRISNNILSEEYSMRTIDSYSLEFLYKYDFEAAKKQRIQNAKYIYNNLHTSADIKFMFSIEQMDCPLFVPILISKKKRNLIKNKLISKSIFCPIHWPNPELEFLSNIYEMELSIICDQRYNVEDMKYIVDWLNVFSEE